MLDTVDSELAAWVRATLGDVRVSHEPPRPGTANAPAISVYLLDLVKTPQARSGRAQPPLQVTARYLVTTAAPAVVEAHRMLGELTFSALAHPEYVVERESLPVELWAGFGVPPQPALVLGVRLTRERPEERAPLVSSAPTVVGTPAITLTGWIIGPGNLPLAGARVECPAVSRVVQTDGRGHFRLSGLPAAPPARLLVTAKGQQLWVETEPAAGAAAPLVVRFDALE